MRRESFICVAVFVVLFGSRLLAQDFNQQAPGTSAAPQQGAVQSLPQSTDSSQIRDDLNKMESLNMNMSSEIEFLHDQNLQILLRTNSQMWTILIRDLRRQLALQEQPKTMAPPGVRK